MEGNLRFKIDWASLIVGSKFTDLLCFTLYFRAIFQVQAPRGAYIWRGDSTEGFLRYRFRVLYLKGLTHGGAYFRNFTVFVSVFISMERSLFHEFSQHCSDTCTICCSFVLAKGEKEPFDFNFSSYGYFSMALSYFF